MKITILHPNFGIGGAERLTLDAAQAFKKKNCEVQIVTNFFTPNHCFDDLLTFQNIAVIRILPQSIFGKFNALCAYINFCIAAIFICIKHNDTDIIFCDLISAPLFLFRFFLKAKILFYCHYPDQLLTERKTLTKKIYRYFIDQIENWTITMAHVIFVNSKYTENVLKTVFPLKTLEKIQILYPSLNIEYVNNIVDVLKNEENYYLNERIVNFKYVFLSINRFEVKKNIDLALDAFATLRKNLSLETFSQCLLVLAGGFDKFNNENILYFEHLKQVVNKLELNNSVLFVLSPDEKKKIQLYLQSCMVIYTPFNEHFGIVPIEAMYLKKPVLACKSGGPLETIVDGETGFLRNNKPHDFQCCMLEAINNPNSLKEMGEKGHIRVLNNFSFENFTEQLMKIIN